MVHSASVPETRTPVAALPPQVSIELSTLTKKHTQKAGAEVRDFVADLLTDAGLAGGPYRLWPVAPIHGTPGRQGKLLNLTTKGQFDLFFSMQPGDNRTAWKYRLNIPRQLSADQVCKQLLGVLEKRQDSSVAHVVSLPESAAEVDVAPEQKPAVIEEVASNESYRLTPHEVLGSLDFLAMGIYSAFAHASELVEVETLADIVREALEIQLPAAEQIVNGALARNYLRRGMGDRSGMVYVTDPELRQKLLHLGVPVKPERPIPVGSAVTERPILRAKAPVPAPAPPRASEKVVAAPAPAVGGTMQKLALLEEKAQAFTQAQRRLGLADEKSTELRGRIVDKERELQELKAELAQHDFSMAADRTLIADSDYATARERVNQILELIG